MRDRLLRGLSLVAIACGLVLVSSVHAQAPGMRVTLEPPEGLTEGDRAEVVAVVELDPPNDLPLLVTPTSEGTAVEVVRGRLLRADAEDPGALPLRFRVPIVARGSGTAVLRVRASGWICAERCRAATGAASVALRVARRRGE